MSDVQKVIDYLLERLRVDGPQSTRDLYARLLESEVEVPVIMSAFRVGAEQGLFSIDSNMRMALPTQSAEKSESHLDTLRKQLRRFCEDDMRSYLQEAAHVADRQEAQRLIAQAEGIALINGLLTSRVEAAVGEQEIRVALQEAEEVLLPVLEAAGPGAISVMTGARHVLEFAQGFLR